MIRDRSRDMILIVACGLLIFSVMDVMSQEDCFTRDPGVNTIDGLFTIPYDENRPHTFYFGYLYWLNDTDGSAECQSICSAEPPCYSYTFISNSYTTNFIWTGECMGRSDEYNVSEPFQYAISGVRCVCGESGCTLATTTEATTTELTTTTDAATTDSTTTDSTTTTPTQPPAATTTLGGSPPGEDCSKTRQCQREYGTDNTGNYKKSSVVKAQLYTRSDNCCPNNQVCGVVVTLQDGSRYLIHDAVCNDKKLKMAVVAASCMSSDWKLISERRIHSSNVGAFVQAGNIDKDGPCIQSCNAMMSLP